LSLIQLDQITRYYGDKLILSSISATIERGDKIGLVGPNGAGKTTLLALLVEEILPDTGSLRKAGQCRIGYLPQRSTRTWDLTLRHLLMQELTEIREMDDALRELEKSMASPDVYENPQLFEEGAPADFILIGATTRDPSEINAALRSRCAEVFFQPLSRRDIQSIVTNAAQRLGVKLGPEVASMISDYTIEGRKATSLVADCYGVALQRHGNEKQVEAPIQIARADLEDVIQSSRLVPYVTVKANQSAEIGKILGLGVSGFLGSVLEIEAIAFTAKGKGRGTLRFNETAGSMAKDSVFNAASVVRQLTGKEIADYDLHVNVIGGGNLDGPSAGLAMVLALISAMEGMPLRQDVAVTGEISLQGKVKPVGGIQEKIYGAMQAQVKRVLVPMENAREIPKGIDGIEIIPVGRVHDAWDLVFAPTESTQATRFEEQFPPLVRKQGIRRLSS
jgi:ATP-dependent Lon protease